MDQKRRLEPTEQAEISLDLLKWEWQTHASKSCPIILNSPIGLDNICVGMKRMADESVWSKISRQATVGGDLRDWSFGEFTRGICPGNPCHPGHDSGQKGFNTKCHVSNKGQFIKYDILLCLSRAWRATKVVDRRKFSRVKTNNLISHVTIDESGRWISQGMSRALDVSRAGIMIETAYPLESGRLSMMTVDMNNNLIEIQGKLIYCRQSDTKMYHSGINFIGNSDEINQFVIQIVRVFSNRKNNLYFVHSNNRLSTIRSRWFKMQCRVHHWNLRGNYIYQAIMATLPQYFNEGYSLCRYGHKKLNAIWKNRWLIIWRKSGNLNLQKQTRLFWN